MNLLIPACLEFFIYRSFFVHVFTVIFCCGLSMIPPCLRPRFQRRGIISPCARATVFKKHGGRSNEMSKTSKCKVTVVLFASIYLVLTIYALKVLLSSEDEVAFPKPVTVVAQSTQKVANAYKSRPSQHSIDVEILGKAAIGLYLWEHILEGPLEERLGGVWSYGQKQIRSVRFTFRTGPGVVPEKVPRQARNVVLVVNGREQKKVEFARAWLDSLKNLPNLRHVAVVILGNERCENDWLFPYMQIHGGLVQFAFIVYDIPYADSKTFYQWPLGVATYRNFPNVYFMSVDAQKRRKFRCNFLGTLYPNSSRMVLQRVINKFGLDSVCFVKTRDSWAPAETAESANDFRYALANSDLTLNPVGMNTECYRIYEACSYGSVPVIEDVVTPGRCKKDTMSPLNLLKTFKAPFIYLKDWRDLPKIIENEMRLSHEAIVNRRLKILSWYKTFKDTLRDKFVDVIQNTFSE